MVHITSFVAVVAALAGQALAIRECVVGQIYCGGTLISGGDSELWRPRVNVSLITAGQPIDGTHQFDSIFKCLTTTTLEWNDWCRDNGPKVICQPNNSHKCTGLNDCCAV